jgi:hypothetical protein
MKQPAPIETIYRNKPEGNRTKMKLQKPTHQNTHKVATATQRQQEEGATPPRQHASTLPQPLQTVEDGREQQLGWPAFVSAKDTCSNDFACVQLVSFFC